MAARHAELAPAKINLCLHVTGQRADGYHLLDSLVCFAAIGDRLEAEPSSGLTLALRGPFACGLPSGADNLVLRAAELIRPPGAGAALRLTKSLPVASGIGGGSADAAAALRLLARLWGLPLPCPEDVLALGADLPVCLGAPRAARMSGIGERLAPVTLPPFWLVLANAGIPVATGAVFAGLARRDNPALAEIPGSIPDLDALLRLLAETRNDLEAAALARAPAIRDALAALQAQARCRLARMSGSGATCFGIFAEEADALAAADALRRAEPRWWVAAAPALGPERPG